MVGEWGKCGGNWPCPSLIARWNEHQPNLGNQYEVRHTIYLNSSELTVLVARHVGMLASECLNSDDFSLYMHLVLVDLMRSGNMSLNSDLKLGEIGLQLHSQDWNGIPS